MIVVSACGGDSPEQQPEVIATLRATASPVPTPAPTASPAPATAAATARATATLPPTDTPTPVANRNPSFPQGPLQGVNTTYERDENDAISGAVTTMVAPAATDADGDALTYAWSVSTGSVTSDGLRAIWSRAIADGREAPGKVTVTATDGRGGTGTLTADFQ